MNQKIIIRDETVADFDMITNVTIEAFNTLAVSNHTEQFIIEALRVAKVLTVPLVAEMDGFKNLSVGRASLSSVG